MSRKRTCEPRLVSPVKVYDSHASDAVSRWTHSSSFLLLSPSSLTGVTIALDATFRTAYKATSVENSKTRTKTYKGGIETVLNEENLIIAWVCLPH